jgi:hypothetical protein
MALNVTQCLNGMANFIQLMISGYFEFKLGYCYKIMKQLCSNTLVYDVEKNAVLYLCRLAFCVHTQRFYVVLK